MGKRDIDQIGRSKIFGAKEKSPRPKTRGFFRRALPMLI
jgi:hypothetical protein